MAHPLFSQQLQKGTPEHRQAVLAVTFIVFGLGALGGLILGFRIDSAEKAQERARAEAKLRQADPKNWPQPGQPGYVPRPMSADTSRPR